MLCASQSLADSKCPTNGAIIIAIKVTESSRDIKGFRDHSVLDPGSLYPGLSPGSGEEPWITPEYKYAVLSRYPFRTTLQKVAHTAQSCHALLGPPSATALGTGSPLGYPLSGAAGRAFGGVAASSSVPALAARQGSCLMGFSSQML